MIAVTHRGVSTIVMGYAALHPSYEVEKILAMRVSNPHQSPLILSQHNTLQGARFENAEHANGQFLVPT